MSTFGVIIPGRNVETNFQQVDTNKVLFVIPDAHLINHVVVFFTNTIPLPLNLAACIFFSLPDPNAPPTWHYLGALRYDKQSAIYKITNLAKAHKLRLDSGDAVVASASCLGFNYTQSPVNHVAQLGISLEPIESIAHMVTAIDNSTSNLSSFEEFINKTITNLYNYCSSFSRPFGQLASDPSITMSPFNKEFVPLQAIQAWYENFSNRLKSDINFWKTLN